MVGKVILVWRRGGAEGGGACIEKGGGGGEKHFHLLWGNMQPSNTN